MKPAAHMMRRLLLAGLALALGCTTEPKRPTLDGLWFATVGGNTVMMRIETDAIDISDGSINIENGPLCFEAGGAGLGPNGSVGVYFFDCIQPSTVSTIQFTGTLSGDTMTGKLDGWTYSQTPATFTR
jgi:hypothetical protein